jgi:hypothetical protein
MSVTPVFSDGSVRVWWLARFTKSLRSAQDNLVGSIPARSRHSVDSALFYAAFVGVKTSPKLPRSAQSRVIFVC